MRLLRLLHQRLTYPKLPILLALLAMLMALPSVFTGWNVDDYLHRAVLTGLGSFRPAQGTTANPFNFFSGNYEQTHWMMDNGYVPWWTHPEIRMQFWRPVTVLTHQIDYALWPNLPSVMHLHNLLWYAGVVYVASLLYRRILGFGAVAGLAAVMYALDDAHSVPAGWIANRNALVATFFGLMSLLMYDRWRRDGWKPGALLAPLCFGVALLSAELGLAASAWLFAYALVLDQGSTMQRLIRILPCATVGVVWMLVYRTSGFGARRSGLYLDPGEEPLRFMAAAVVRAPVLLLSALGFPPADYHSLVPRMVGNIILAVAVLALVMAFRVFLPLLRALPAARFFLVGALLSVIPICATFPMDRLLFFVGFGTMGLIALFLGKLAGWITLPEGAAEPSSASAAASPVQTAAGPIQAAPSRRTRALGLAWVGCHLVLAPLLFPLTSMTMAGISIPLETLARSLPQDPALSQQTLVVVSALDGSFAGYTTILRIVEGMPSPVHMRLLAAGDSDIELFRPDERTLVVRPGKGYLKDPFVDLIRNREDHVEAGYTVQLSDLTIETTDLTPDGRPAEATFRFTKVLEDPSFRWVRIEGMEFVPFTPPSVGQTVRVPAPAAPFLSPST